VLTETVQVGQNFTLRLVWDSPNDRFIARVATAANSGSDVFLTYDPSVNVGPASVPVANLLQRHSAANCIASPTEVDSLTNVLLVETNRSAIVP
jgi:hypothetical protein